jgi:hypothetical protein
MARIPRHQGRADPKVGPSDSSDTFSDRPEKSTDSDAGGTGERRTVGKVPEPRDTGTDRVVDSQEAGLGGGLDQAEEAQQGKTDEQIARERELQRQRELQAERVKTRKP